MKIEAAICHYFGHGISCHDLVYEVWREEHDPGKWGVFTMDKQGKIHSRNLFDEIPEEVVEKAREEIRKGNFALTEEVERLTKLGLLDPWPEK